MVKNKIIIHKLECSIQIQKKLLMIKNNYYHQPIIHNLIQVYM